VEPWLTPAEFETGELARLMRLMRDLDVRPVAVASRNPWKRTIGIVVVDGSGNPLLLKWHAPRSAPSRVRAWFAAERQAYEQRVLKPYTPQMIAAGENWIALEFVFGWPVLTVLDASLALDDLRRVEQVTRVWLRAVLDIHRDALTIRSDLGPRPPLSTDSFRAAFLGLHRSFTRSGPMRNPRTFKSACLGFVLWQVTLPVVRRAIHDLPSLAIAGPSHGDLHLDNLWLDGEERVRIVDLATWSEKGHPALDLVYPMAATLARCSHDRRAVERVVAVAHEALDGLGEVGEQAIRAARLLAGIGAANPRFAPFLRPARRRIAAVITALGDRRTPREHAAGDR
jgi:hypothetical protein